MEICDVLMCSSQGCVDVRRKMRALTPDILSYPVITIHTFLPYLQAWPPAVIPRHRACP